MSSLLDEAVKEQVREVLAEMKDGVEIIYFGSKKQSCEYCKETGELLEEVTKLSDKLHLQAYDLETHAELARQYRIDKAPGFVIQGHPENDLYKYGIRFYGIPAGHEFTSLINVILLVSKRDSGLSRETREALSKINKPVRMQVFVTPTCPYCPRAVVMAHQMAMENELIEAEMVEAMEFSELADKYGVSGVPHTIINDGKADAVGAVPEPHLLQKIQQAVL